MSWLHSCGGLHSDYAHWQLSLECYFVKAQIHHAPVATVL